MLSEEGRAKEAGLGLLGLRHLQLVCPWAKGCPEHLPGRAEKPGPTSPDQPRGAKGSGLGDGSQWASGWSTEPLVQLLGPCPELALLSRTGAPRLTPSGTEA